MTPEEQAAAQARQAALRGLSAGTVAGMRNEGVGPFEGMPVAPPAAPQGTWATATPVRPDQTRRHPGTGAPMTEREWQGLQLMMQKTGRGQLR